MGLRIVANIYSLNWVIFTRHFSPEIVLCMQVQILCTAMFHRVTLIVRFMGPIWGPSGADRTQVGPMLASWTLLFGQLRLCLIRYRSFAHNLYTSHMISAIVRDTPDWRNTCIVCPVINVNVILFTVRVVHNVRSATPAHASPWNPCLSAV